MFGNCRCIPKNDKANLITAIEIAKKSYEDEIKLEEKSLFSYNVPEIREKLRDVFDLEFRIRDTPPCNDGHILDHCTCLSDFEKNSLDYILVPTINKFTQMKNIDAADKIEELRKNLKSISKTC